MNIQLKRITAFVLILFVGVMIGVMGTRIAFRALLAKALEKPSIVSEKFDASLKKLTLPPEQEQKVAQILKEFHDQRQNLRAEFQPRLRKILTDTRQGILAELTHEQQIEFRNAVRDELPLLWQIFEDRQTDS